MKLTMEWQKEEKQKYFSLGDIAPRIIYYRIPIQNIILMEQNILMSPLLSTAINY